MTPGEPTVGPEAWSGGLAGVGATDEHPAADPGAHAAADAASDAPRVGRARATGVRLFGVVSLETPHATPHATPHGSHAAIGAAAGGRGAGSARVATPAAGMAAVPGGAPAGERSSPGDPRPGAAEPIADGTELVAYRDVAAVLAPAAYVADALTPRDLDRHREVIDAAFARRAVVPAPPGTVFRSRDLVAGWLELHYYTLVEALSFLEDRAAARVSVTRAEPTPVTSLRLAPVDTMEFAVAGDLTLLAAESFRALRGEAVALLILRAGADAVTADASAHGSFLVERRRWREFEQAVGIEAARHPDLRFHVTGPWPPYDFVRMQFSS